VTPTTATDVYEALERESATGKSGQLVTVPASGDVPLERVLLVGVGDGSPAMFRRAGAAVCRAARGTRALLYWLQTAATS